MLLDRGAMVRDLTFYCVVPNRHLGRALPEHDVIFFVSPAGVRAYYYTYGSAAFQGQAWCLGEDTRRELLSYGIEATVLAADELDAANTAISA